MGNETVRISVRVPERYRRRLKIAAASGGEKLEEFCLRALNTQLEQPGSSARPGPLGELTAEELRLLEHYRDLIRLDKGLADVARKRIEQFLAIAREQPMTDYIDHVAFTDRMAKIVREQITEQLAHLGPLPGAGPALTEALSRAIAERNADPQSKPQTDPTESDNLKLLELLKRREALAKNIADSDAELERARPLLESLIGEAKKRGDEEPLPVSVEKKST